MRAGNEPGRGRGRGGDGLTDVVPDTLAAEVIERDLVPAFRRGDWVGGLDDGLRTFMDAAR